MKGTSTARKGLSGWILEGRELVRKGLHQLDVIGARGETEEKLRRIMSYLYMFFVTLQNGIFIASCLLLSF